MDKPTVVYIVPLTHAWNVESETTKVLDHEILMVKYEDYLKLEERLKQLEGKN